jgi:hypothetical protein
MGDVTQTMHKVAVDLLEPGEEIIAGAKCTSVGTIKGRALSVGLVGVVGMLVHSKVSRTPEHALFGQALPRDLALGLTDRRVIVFSVGSMTGKPANVLGSIHLAQLVGVETDEGRVFGAKLTRFTLRFADGSALALETSGIGVRPARDYCQALADSLAERAQDGGSTPHDPGRGPGASSTTRP